MKKLVPLLLLVSSPGFAAEFSNPVAELSFSPGIGYSSSYGLSSALEASALIPVTEQWDARLGVNTWAYRDDSSVDVRLGLLYNFSEDRGESYFAGFGVETYKTWEYDESLDKFEGRKKARGYLEVGKRFEFKSVPHLAYTPGIEAKVYAGGGVDFILNVLSFSYTF